MMLYIKWLKLHEPWLSSWSGRVNIKHNYLGFYVLFVYLRLSKRINACIINTFENVLKSISAKGGTYITYTEYIYIIMIENDWKC